MFLFFVGEEVFFDENGDGPGRYDVLNLQDNSNDIEHPLHYVQVGTWSTGKLTLNTSAIRFFADQRSLSQMNIRRFCSEACPVGHVKVCFFFLLTSIFYFYLLNFRNILMKNDVVGNVIRVVLQLYLMKQHVSLVQPDFHRMLIRLVKPSYFDCNHFDFLACGLLSITTINFHHPLSIMICFVAGIGILISFFVVYIFVRFNATPVVKSTTRELSYLILMGILFCHLTAFVILQKPSFIICVLTRLLPGISFSMIYGSLVTKTNRIARILARSKKKIITRRLKFMSARHQLAIACLILVTEVTIVGKGFE
jgi:metabotropic glutamate receptor 1